MLILRNAVRSAKRSLMTTARSVADRHPVVTNALVYGGLYTLAEVSQQQIQNKMQRRRDISPKGSAATAAAAGQLAHLDMSSVKRYAIMGTIVFPPILTKWYHWLDARFPCTSGSVVTKKLILDQFILTPWLLAIFFIGMSYLEGQRGESALKECKSKFIKTFTLDCVYWLPIQAVNFLFVPAGLRVAYIGVTTFVWLNVLCYIKSAPHV